MASYVGDVRITGGVDVLVFANGASASCLLRIVCKASIVADGGVFSPKIGRLRWLGVALPLGVGVSDPDRVGLRSGDLLCRYSSYSDSFGVRSPFSGDRRSSESLMPLTLMLCIDCMRLCWGLMRLLSGELPRVVFVM